MRIALGFHALWVLILTAMISPVVAADLTLVDNGKPSATIVTAAKPSENAKTGAAELQRYVKAISGAELPIVSDDQPSPAGTLILVGASKLTEAMGDLKIPTGLTKNIREEGFVLLSRDNKLVLAGNDTGPYFGTRYAVCEVLNRIGVRWFMPGEFGEVVPRQATIKIENNLEVRQKPDFAIRSYWHHNRGDMLKEDIEWRIHNKMNPALGGSEDYFAVPGDGSISQYIPVDQFEAHPDWFALDKDGKRQKGMVCMTSEGMIHYFAEKIKAEAKAGKHISAFAPDDGSPRCYCDNCKKLATAFDGYGANERDPVPESSTSNEWFYFVNRVLAEVNKDYPDHIIATNGYANRDIPPEINNFNPNKNLMIMFANICACTIHSYDDPHCWQMERQGQMIKRWCELSDKVWIYNYDYTMLVSKHTITPMVHRLRHNIPMLKEWGLMGFNDQDEANWALDGIPTHIIRARLEWDTKADVDAVLKDFFDKWFGRSSKPMQAYYDALEDAFEKTEVHGHEDVILNAIYTPDLMATLDKHMKKAEGLAQSDSEKGHVALERMIYDYLRNYVAMEDAKRECHFAEAATLAQSLFTRLAALNQITPFMGYHPYPVYGPEWEAQRMQALAKKTDGPEGELVAVLPEKARVRIDPTDDGRFERWQETGYDDSSWKPIRTTLGWDTQGFTDKNGHPFKGVMWYRMNTDIPASASGKNVWLCAPAAIEEAWVWVNGQYAGHRAYQSPWFRPQQVDMDISQLIKAGKSNQITIRMLGNIDCFGANGIYERMFLYAKK